jgi:hypothetical protein
MIPPSRALQPLRNGPSRDRQGADPLPLHPSIKSAPALLPPSHALQPLRHGPSRDRQEADPPPRPSIKSTPARLPLHRSTTSDIAPGVSQGIPPDSNPADPSAARPS